MALLSIRVAASLVTLAWTAGPPPYADSRAFAARSKDDRGYDRDAMRGAGDEEARVLDQAGQSVRHDHVAVHDRAEPFVSRGLYPDHFLHRLLVDPLETRTCWSICKHAWLDVGGPASILCECMRLCAAVRVFRVAASGSRETCWSEGSHALSAEAADDRDMGGSSLSASASALLMRWLVQVLCWIGGDLVDNWAVVVGGGSRRTPAFVHDANGIYVGEVAVSASTARESRRTPDLGANDIRHDTPDRSANEALYTDAVSTPQKSLDLKGSRGRATGEPKATPTQKHRSPQKQQLAWEHQSPQKLHSPHRRLQQHERQRSDGVYYDTGLQSSEPVSEKAFAGDMASMMLFVKDHTDDEGNYTAVPRWASPRRLTRSRQQHLSMAALERFSSLTRWMLIPFVILATLACMMPGNRGDRFGNQFGGGPGGLGSLKVPPSWSAEHSHEYSFRAWLADVILWAGATDLEEERHGPAVAMQVHGAAREVIREIPAQTLRQGRVNQAGQAESGLMVLMRMLAERYSPLEVESSTRSIAELINLRRLGHESIDSYLTRFDVLRARAQNRANLNVGASGLAWLLLNGLRAPPDLWDRALMPFNGALPQNDQQLAVLTERLRRQGHLHEQSGIAQLGRESAMRQGGLGGNATYYFPTFGTNNSTNYAPASGDADQGVYHYPAGGTAEFGGDRDGQPSCPTCGQYFADGDSSDTSSDDGTTSYFGEGMDPNMDANELGNILHNDYHIAKRRWRKFRNKLPRRHRLRLCLAICSFVLAFCSFVLAQVSPENHHCSRPSLLFWCWLRHYGSSLPINFLNVSADLLATPLWLKR